MAPGRLLPLLLLLPAAAAIEARPGPNGLPLLELCSLPRAVGRCRAAVPRWWFNLTAGSCQSFIFGGCDGNGNNFPTERECRESCGPAAAPKNPQHRAEDAAAAYAEHCAVPRVTGPCRASFLRWFYSPANRSCRQFIYGGCRGNKNNYQNEEDCLKRCGPEPDATGADFRGDFFSAKALALGVLLAVLAAVLLGYVTNVALKTCRGKPELLAAGAGWSPGDDKEHLMSNTYTL